MYGYALADQGTAVEVINLRLQSIGRTDKPRLREEAHSPAPIPRARAQGRAASLYVPEEDGFRTAPVYDGHATRCGYRVAGPALIEQVNTAILISAGFDCVCDKHGSYAIYAKGREELARVDGAAAKTL